MEYTFRQTNFRNHKKTIWVIKEQKLQTFVLRPMYLHVQQMITSLQKEVMSLMFPGKEVDFAKSLFDKQHDFNGTSLEVNKIRQSFYLGHHTRSTEICIKLFTRSSRNKRCSFSTSLNFY